MLAGGFALAGCGAGTDSGTGGFAVQGVDIADCVANPFDAACDSAEFDDAKQYRLAFCSLEQNTGHVRCANINTNINININTGVTLETQNTTPQDTVLSLHPCESTPFSPNCGAIYETARQTRAEYCGQADNATAPQCRGAIVSDPCILDPNRPDCGGDYADNRAERLAFCALLTNAQNPICIPILSRPTYATWLHSFQTPLFTRASDQRRSDTKEYAEILQASANGLDLGDIMEIEHYDFNNISKYPTRTATLRLINKQGKNGFVNTQSLYTFDDIGSQYVGILSSTDLGAPLPEPDAGAPTQAIWVALLQSANVPSHYFSLTVDLADKSIFANPSNGFSTYNINGTFNDHGVIAGTISYKIRVRNSESGVMTGLIGEAGAIAVFKTNATSHAGGFIASPHNKSKDACSRDGNANTPACYIAITADRCVYDPFLIGCFHNYENARLNRIVFCIQPLNVDSEFCQSAIYATCDDEPFAPHCGMQFDDNRVERLGYCMHDANVASDKCAGVIAFDACIGNPFGQDCDDYDTARMSRTAFCIKPANVESAICIPAITDSCTATPFASHCGAQFDTTRDERTAFCQRDNNAISDTCAGAVKNTLCLRRPFTRTCGRDYDTVRDNLRGFCMQSANTANPLCTDFALTMCIFEDNAKQSFCADAVAAEPCIKMPFELGCGVRYNEAQWYRVFWCAKGANAQDALCANNTCIQNPFGASCMHKNYSITRAERITFCTPSANQTHALCAEVNARVTTARWVNGFDYPLPPAAAMADTWSKFLRGTFDGLDVGDLRDDAGASPIVHTLNMRNGAGGENLAGSKSSDSSNGVGFFQYTPQGGRTRYYAGLFSGVNLGAPLVNPDVNPDGFIVWHGWLHETGLRTPIPISFNINLSTRRFHAFEVVGHVLYEFTTDFDAQGVITGYLRKSINRNDRYGTVHGLIGEAGAIGAFVGNEIGGRGYAGGFIARPPSE